MNTLTPAQEEQIQKTLENRFLNRRVVGGTSTQLRLEGGMTLPVSFMYAALHPSTDPIWEGTAKQRNDAFRKLIISRITVKRPNWITIAFDVEGAPEHKVYAEINPRRLKIP